jgi:hypothetical protein
VREEVLMADYLWVNDLNVDLLLINCNKYIVK